MKNWNRDNNSSVSVMVDSGASCRYFDDAIFPGLRYTLNNYQGMALRHLITTVGGHELKGAGQGLFRSHTIDTKGVYRLIQL